MKQRKNAQSFASSHETRSLRFNIFDCMVNKETFGIRGERVKILLSKLNGKEITQVVNGLSRTIHSR